MTTAGPSAQSPGPALEMGAPMEGSPWVQYVALVRRNFTIKLRERRKTITEFVLPLYFLFILAILRVAIPAPTYPAVLTQHDQGSVCISATMLNGINLHVTPNTTEVEEVGNAVAQMLGGSALYYDTEEDIVAAYRKNSSMVQAALVFTASPLADRNYTVRFNPKMRPLPDPSNRWVSSTSCRGEANSTLESPVTCPPNRYYFSGFLGLQALVDWTILTKAGAVETTTPPPLETTSFPSETSSPHETTSSPPETTSSPPETTSSLPETTSSLPETTSSPPVTTSSPPVTTSSPPVTTSSPPVTTSSPPVTTSSPPVTTSSPPVTISSPQSLPFSPQLWTSPLDKSIDSFYCSHASMIPSIELATFPMDAVVSTNLDVLRSIIPLYMVFTWAQFIVYMLILIVEEKEKKIKEGMKMMGLQGVVYWLSWLTVYGLYVVILATICVIVLPLAKIFQYANLGLVFLLFILYGLSSIILALLMTPFFSKAKVAGVVGNLLQVFMSLLFYLQVYLGDEIDPVYFWLMGLMSPCAFSLAIDKILTLDVTSGGLSSSTIWEGPGLPFAGSLIMISVDIVLYLILALYLDAVVPTEYGTKEKPWFFLQPSFWKTKKKTYSGLNFSNPEMEEHPIEDEEERDGHYDTLKSHSSSSSGASAEGDVERVGSEMRGKEGVIIKGVSKVFKRGRSKPDLHAVKNFSLTIYEDQITAILGHNGAGKTTLFNMLTGMTEITSGSATVFGLNVGDSGDLREIRSMTGVCPQHDILFAVLTPREHLMFYARIRGIKEDKLEEVVETTLKEVDLATKADCKADDLSGGQKRKLSIGIALIGDPRIIFLDEPTAGVDAYSRRRLWGLLKRRKQGKVILLTTHFMDEADVLADRKAVMTRGQLRCCGSSLFLKNKFGLGYHLTLIVGQDTPSEKVLELLRREVPNATLVRHYGKEMTFVLQDTPAHLFPGMFRMLEQCRDGGAEVPIEDYGVSMTTLEEVFLALNTDNNDEEGSDGERSDSGSHFESAVGSGASQRPSPDFESRALDGKGPATAVEGKVDEKREGFAIEEVEVEYSAWRAFKALMKLRIVSVLREPLAIIFMVVFPLGFTAGGIALVDSQGIQTPTETLVDFVPDLILKGPNSLLVHNSTDHPLEGWTEVLNQTGLASVPYNGTYEEIFGYRPQVAAANVNAFPEFLSQSPNGSPSQQPSLDVALYYNTSYLHSLPVLLNFISNAFVLQTEGPDGLPVHVQSRSLPAIKSSIEFDVSSFFAPMLIGMVYNMVPVGLVIDMVQDREIHARNILRLNGVSFNLYFSTFFLLLSVIYFISYIGLLVIVLAFNVASLTLTPAFITLAVMYLMYLPSALLFAGAMSYIFDSADTARQFYPNFGSTIGMVAYTIVSLVDILVTSTTTDPGLIVHCVFAVFIPWYIPFGILYYINKVYLECSLAMSCEDVTINDYMTPEISLMFFMNIFNSVFYYFVLRAVDALKTGGNLREAFFLSVPESAEEELWEQEVVMSAKEDEDVKQERQRAERVAKDATAPAVVYNLGKTFKGASQSRLGGGNKKKEKKKKEAETKNLLAVESVSVALQPGEVLGLLGPNGAGKTTTLKMLTAEESPSRGGVWVSGGRVNSVLSPTLQSLGYCPQHDVLWKKITVREHLELYCNVRGVKEKQLQQLLDAYLDGLQIKEHAEKQSHQCSGGTKRKLSYIISMMGRPGVVLLDEPSTGMDPRSKRFLWDSILASFKGDRSAVLTTHSMEEADALCARIGIMVKGALRCIGSVQRLKNKYGGGYNLEIKMRPRRKRGVLIESDGSEAMNEVQRNITSAFPHCALDEPPFEGRLVYKIPQEDVHNLAESFSMFEELRTKGLIAEYSFSQTTLEQVFLLFAREQELVDEEEGVDNTVLQEEHF